MDEYREENIFYISNRTKIFRLVLLLLLTAFFGWLSFILLMKDSIYYFTLIIAFISFFFLVRSFFKLLIPTPYIILAEKGMTLFVESRREVTVAWGDISGFRIEYSSFVLHLHIGLYDETKYEFKKNALLRGFYIPWYFIKRKDRGRFFEGINKWKDSATNDPRSAFEKENHYLEEKRRISLWYIIRAFLAGIIISLGFYYIFDFFTDFNLYIVYTLLFPFSKIAYDKLFGFSLYNRMDRETHHAQIAGRLFIVIFLLWLGVYLLNYVLAPIGFIYLIMDMVKKKGQASK